MLAATPRVPGACCVCLGFPSGCLIITTFTWKQVRAPTPTTDRRCHMGTPCGFGEIEVTAMTKTTDRVCTRLASDRPWYKVTTGAHSNSGVDTGVQFYGVPWADKKRRASYSETDAMQLCKSVGMRCVVTHGQAWCLTPVYFCFCFCVCVLSVYCGNVILATIEK